jgi:hypothetical protein
LLLLLAISTLIAMSKKIMKAETSTRQPAKSAVLYVNLLVTGSMQIRIPLMTGTPTDAILSLNLT